MVQDIAVKMLGYALRDKIENDFKCATHASLQFVRGIL